MAAATVVVLAFAPVAAMAARGGSSRSPLRTAVEQSSPRAHNAAASVIVLAPGSGYFSSGGSARVRALQRRLARAGEVPGPIDGRYGPLTEQAVRHFQAAHGLQIDGITGPDTLAALAAPTRVLYPAAGYQPGVSARVRALQRGLARAGEVPGPIDGRYGPLTEQAVRHFQAAHGLQVDGITGLQTITRLDNLARSRQSHQRPPRTTAPYRRPAPAHPSRLIRGPSQPAGSSLTPWLVLLGALGLGLSLTAAWYMRARPRPGRGDRSILSRKPRGNAEAAAALDPAGAERTYRRADQSGEAFGAFNLGLLLEGRGDLAGAEAAYRRADQRGHVAVAFNLGVVLEARRDLAGAEAAYRRADQRGHAAAASNLGVLLEAQNDRAGAETAYRRADQGGEATGAFNLGLLLEARNDLAGAEAAYRRADQRGHGAAASNLGVLLEEQNDRAGAEAAYRRADQRGDAAGAFNLGVLLEEQHERAGAKAAYRRADQRGDFAVAKMAGTALLGARRAIHSPSNGRSGGGRNGASA